MKVFMGDIVEVTKGDGTVIEGGPYPPLQKKEAVNHPDHYGGKNNPYEAIKVIDAWNLGFCLGNTVKYIARAGKKGGHLERYVEDLEKARWYLDHDIQRLKGTSPQAQKTPAEIVAEWRKQHGGHNKVPKAHPLKLLEEVLELCFAAGAGVQEVNQVVAAEVAKGKKKEDILLEFNPAAVKEEVGDVFSCLLTVATENGFTVEEAFFSTESKFSGRKWSVDVNGVLRRPRDV